MALSKSQNFFVEGSGTAHVMDDNNVLSLSHLQDMTLELTSTMENIYGGEGNFALYSYNTEKGLKVNFTNASWNLDILNLTQGVTSNENTSVFTEEKVTVGTASGTGLPGIGGIKTSHHGDVDFTAPIMIYASDNTVVFAYDGEKITNGTATLGTGASASYDVKLPTSYSGTTLTAVYNYTLKPTDKINGISSSLYTTGVPGFVTIHHRSKPMKQKDGRIIRLFTTIYRARCDGNLTINLKHKNAFAPELAFEVIDPERADGKYMVFGIIDTTELDKNNKFTTVGF